MSDKKDKAIDVDRIPEIMAELGVNKRIAVALLVDPECVKMEDVAKLEKKGK